MEHKLVEISVNSLQKLKEIYKIEWPNHMSSYYVIDTCIRWLTQNPKLNFLKIYSLNGDWEEDGTFVVIRGTSLFFNTLQESCDKIKILLSLIDLSEPYIISSFEERLKPIIYEVLNLQKVPNKTENCTHFYYLPKEEALKLQFEVPENIVLKPLIMSDAPQVYEIWNNKNEDSIEYIKTLIEYNPTMGAYTKKDELVAWCFRLETGDISLLQVEEKYLRKGYGTLVTVELARVFAEMGCDSAATILTKNFKSQELFSKLGFKNIYDTYWIWTGTPP